jgi:hypothetical protein
MVVIGRIAYLRGELRAGRQCSVHCSYNPLTKCEKIKILVKPCSSTDEATSHVVTMAVLNAVESAMTIGSHVSDRGHLHLGTGVTEVCFYVSGHQPMEQRCEVNYDNHYERGFATLCDDASTQTAALDRDVVGTLEEQIKFLEAKIDLLSIEGPPASKALIDDIPIDWLVFKAYEDDDEDDGDDDGISSTILGMVAPPGTPSQAPAPQAREPPTQALTAVQAVKLARQKMESSSNDEERAMYAKAISILSKCL